MGQYCFARCRLSSSSVVVCNARGWSSAAGPDAWQVRRRTLHGGTVLLRPVRATNCSKMLAVGIIYFDDVFKNKKRCQTKGSKYERFYFDNAFKTLSNWHADIEQKAQLSPIDPRDALYPLKCCPTVVRIKQADRLSAWCAVSATAAF